MSCTSIFKNMVQRNHVSRLPKVDFQNFQKLLTTYASVERNTYLAFMIYHGTATLITMRSLSWKSLKFENKRVVVHGVSTGLLCALPKELHPDNMVATTETCLIYWIDRITRSWTALAGVKTVYSCSSPLLSCFNIPPFCFLKIQLAIDQWSRLLLLF